ncbi:MAG: bifunctional 5,10-methylenetetrahydrofolate dehydrogenase/5,10-methenyltetrahydrofolate cyclohydrolase [Lachnospiraceae bacterium]|nr:bifunctional 5,10-methylenetetrahydrofolate dehydrogenase/5,10-methenyltetrahydrofolate cyclohydrolase [Lachnospiraceae bacterium]
MEILKGMTVVNAMKETMKSEIAQMEQAPLLAIVRVGERPDDCAYERGAMKRMSGLGIRTRSCVFDADISNEAFQEAFLAINGDPEVDGILLLRPLPSQIDEKAITELIDPKKDVDGISPVNMAKLFMGEPDGFAPCTPEAVVEMLKFAGVELAGKHAVIVGRSLVVGKPLAMLLMKENCTVTVCHSRTKNLQDVCRSGEILVAAIGKAEMLDGSFAAPGAVVLDVGINVNQEGKLCGDVAFDTLDASVALATPVPGGVGTVTTSVLAKHVIRAAKQRREHAQRDK